MNHLYPKRTSVVISGLSFLAALLLLLLFGSASVTASAAESTATLTFNTTGVTAAGASGGYEIDGTDVSITAAGTYTLTGSCPDGSVTVKKGVTGVTLVLEDLTLTSTDSAPLCCNKETVVTLRVTGRNVLTDGEDIANEASDQFDGAALKVKSGGDLTITGDGTLTINGSCKNGIKGASLAAVTVDGPTLIIDAANNGLACDNTLVIRSGDVTVTAGNDGIKAEPDEDDADSAGTVTISGGTFRLNTVGDSIQSAGDMTVTGGSFTIESGDDGLKSAGNLTVTGGTFQISAEDDGLSADYVLTVGTEGAASGPSITVSKCTEGLEGATVNLNAGEGVITTGDDGINAANKDLTDYAYAITITGGSWYVNSDGDAMDSNGSITITGGVTELYGSPNNGNNALDYEGTCTVADGTLFTVDCAGMNQVPSSGVYVIFGRTGGMGGGMMPGGDQRTGDRPTPPDGQMPERPFRNTDGNGQNGFRPDENGSMPALTDGMTPPDFSGGDFGGAVDTSAISIQSGTEIAVKDSGGKTLYSAVGTKLANCVMLSSADLKAGETYTLYLDGEAVATAEAAEGTGQGGFAPGGQRPGQQGGQTDPGTPSGGRPATSGGYTDVAEGSWYHDAVAYVTGKGLMTGTGNGQFSPGTETTRGMVVTILYRLEGSPAVGASSYADVSSGDWYAQAVAWAEENGIVQGTGDGRFSPGEPVTRQQLAAILYRYAQYKGCSLEKTADLSEFTDGGRVHSYARTALSWACASGLVQGMGDGTIQPGGSATRGQVAVILQRLNETVLQ